MPQALTLDDLAAALDVDTRTVQRWVGKGCPHEREPEGRRRYRFDLAAVIAWRAANVGASGRGGGEDVALIEARTRLAHVHADRIEQAVAKLQAEHADAVEVRETEAAALERIEQVMTRHVEAAIAELVPGAPELEVDELLRRHMRAGLTELAGG